MIAAIAILLVALIAVLVVGAVGLRSWGMAEARTEARLRSPTTHTISYVVPRGQDPAILMAALAGAGFTTVVDNSAPAERILVACAETDRDRVREVLEHVDRTGFDGAEMHVAHVTFDDER